MKLIPNLLPKSKYLVHYLNLRFYLEHGMRLIDVHRVLRFQQSRWLAPYIEKKSTLRAAGKNDFEKDEQLDIRENLRESEEADRDQAHHK